MKPERDVHAEGGEAVPLDVGRKDLFYRTRYLLELKGPAQVRVLYGGAEGEGEKEGTKDEGEDREDLHDAPDENGDDVAETRQKEAEREKEAGKGFVKDDNIGES